MNVVLILAAMTAMPAPCSARAELARAASAYRTIQSLHGAADIRVQIPGAPPHQESLEYDFVRDQVFMRMPAGYTIQLRGDRIRIIEEGRPGAHVSAPAGTNLQASLDAAFEGSSSPVIPPPVLLRRAGSFAEQLQSFRLKVLGPFTHASCSGGEVRLTSDSGSARFHVPKDGFIEEIHAEIVTAAQQPPIAVEVRLTRESQRTTGQFRAAGRAVRSVKELRALPAVAMLPDVTLREPGGKEVRIHDRLRGTTVIEFWATWCAPCRVTLPKVVHLARSRSDIRVLLVNLKEDSTRIHAYLAAAGIDTSTLIDMDGRLHEQLGGGLPLTIVVSADGRILKSHAGFDADVAKWLAAIP